MSKAHVVSRAVTAMTANAAVTAAPTMAGTTCTATSTACAPSTSPTVGPSQIRNGNAHCETKREYP
jgi:hypothetical protein